MTAVMLAHIAEVDARRLYLPAAYPSMFAYCVGELRLCEQAAFKRIRAARTARQFPAVFEAVADGRLHLSAVVLLTPYLTEETADELLAAATHKTKSEIEVLLAQGFPQPEMPTQARAISTFNSSVELSPGTVGAELQLSPGTVEEHAPGHVGEQLSPGTVQTLAGRAKVTPLAPGLFAVQVTIGQNTHDKLRYAQDLLGHQIPSGDIATVLDRALVALIGQLEKRKFAATARPLPARRSTKGQRGIPAHVRRTVWQRDGGRCTFESEAGRRCQSRKFIEFDHMDEVARGGEASVDRIRLRCRAHNQYGAECTFGTEFMRHKRREAAEARAAAKARAQAAAAEVIPYLRQLQIPAGEARLAAAPCQRIPDAPIEERVRLALSCLRPRTTGPNRAAVSREAPASLAAAGPIGNGAGHLAGG